MKYILSIILLFMFAVTANAQDCTGESDCGGGNTEPCPTKLGEITLCWDANTEPDLAGYRIYYGRESGGWDTDNPIDINDPDATGTFFTIDDTGDWFLVMTAYDDDNNESAYSDELWLRISIEDGNIKIETIDKTQNFRFN